MEHAGERDFDFLIGRWHVRHRRLKERLTGNEEWQEFDGTCTVQPLLDGAGNVDDNLLHLPAQTYRAVTLRAFDARTGRWAIWWLDGRNPHTLDTPMMGSFERGIGTFYAEDTHERRPIRIRFRWTDTQTASPRWEQAFSADAGRTWEINWTMTFDRMQSASGSPTAARTPLATAAELDSPDADTGRLRGLRESCRASASKNARCFARPFARRGHDRVLHDVP